MPTFLAVYGKKATPWRSPLARWAYQGGPPVSLSGFHPLVSLVLPDLAVMLSVSVSIRTIEH